MNLYNLKMLTPNTFALAKFDSDFNVVAIYNLAPKGHSYTCDCPANQRSVVTKPCKHKRFLPLMLGAVNTDRFYEPETGRWHQPLGDLHREPPIEAEAQPEDASEALRAEAPTIASYKELEPGQDIAEEFSKLLLGPVEPPEGLVGEALGSSAEPALTIIDEASSVTQAMYEGLEGFPSKAPTPAPVAPTPTIRRR